MNNTLKTLCLLPLLSASAAAADTGAGLRAFEAGEYETAQRLLSEDDARFDGKALLARGRMALEGLGQTPDFDEAYLFLSLAMQFDTGQDEAQALWARAAADDHLDPDRVRAAERQVTQLVNEHFGAKAVAGQVQTLIRQLNDCKMNCDDIASQLFVYGPAASDAIPALEAVMTRDSYWLPRGSYTTALMLIGTASVPALCRIMADKTELLYEGPYNTVMSLEALSQMGTAARAALPCVMDAVERRYPAMPLSPPYPDPGDQAAWLKEVKANALIALIEIGDPDRSLADRLRAWFDAESDLLLRQFAAAAICHDHADYGPAAMLAAEVLPKPASNDRNRMLLILDSECGDLPGLTTTLAPFKQDLLRISQEESPAGAAAAALISRFPD